MNPFGNPFNPFGNPFNPFGNPFGNPFNGGGMGVGGLQLLVGGGFGFPINSTGTNATGSSTLPGTTSAAPASTATTPAAAATSAGTTSASTAATKKLVTLTPQQLSALQAEAQKTKQAALNRQRQEGKAGKGTGALQLAALQHAPGLTLPKSAASGQSPRIIEGESGATAAKQAGVSQAVVSHGPRVVNGTGSSTGAAALARSSAFVATSHSSMPVHHGTPTFQAPASAPYHPPVMHVGPAGHHVGAAHGGHHR
jgi:hypothetical protein